jgi:threonine/homoserine/homoserine lactone efflux protein
MESSLLLKGMLLGFSIAAPVGPIGILCIRRTLQHGRLSGLFSGIGAALADTIYAIIAAFGLTFISDFLLAAQYWLHLIGGAFLLYLGIKTGLSKPAEKVQMPSHKSLLNDFISTFLLTITNPMTILAFLAIFAAFGLTSVQGSYADTSAVVAGVFIGSAIWWIILSEGVTLFRKKVSQKVMLWINRIAGLIITAFGIWVLLSL